MYSVVAPCKTEKTFCFSRVEKMDRIAAADEFVFGLLVILLKACVFIILSINMALFMQLLVLKA